MFGSLKNIKRVLKVPSVSKQSNKRKYFMIDDEDKSENKFIALIKSTFGFKNT